MKKPYLTAEHAKNAKKRQKILRLILCFLNIFEFSL